MVTTSCVGVLAVRRTFTACPKSVREGRGWAVGVARFLAPGVDEDAVRLLTSELITNAVEHSAADEIRIEVFGECAGVTVVVTDDGGGTEVGAAICADANDEHGRGLYIVEAYADRWGVVLCAGSRMVWFTLATDRAAR